PDGSYCIEHKYADADAGGVETTAGKIGSTTHFYGEKTYYAPSGKATKNEKYVDGTLGQTITYTYNPDGSIASETTTTVYTGVTKTTTIQYGPDGSVISKTETETPNTKTSYDWTKYIKIGKL